MIHLSNAHIAQVATMSDGGMKIVLHTPELAEAEMIALFAAKTGKLNDIVKFPESKEEPKSHAARLRSVLFILFEQTKGGDTNYTFEMFYRDQMEKIINHFKEKLS